MFENTIAITIDVEWVCDEVLQYVVDLLDQHEIKATFFCTHPNINVSGHERAIHPNFRRNGDSYKKLKKDANSDIDLTDTQIYEFILNNTLSFCSEAIGTRSHCLFYDSDLLPIYKKLAIKYDSSYFFPMMNGITPFFKEYEILEIPIYYMDHWDLIENKTLFKIEKLNLNTPGLKVFDFHPNILYINAYDEYHYESSKKYYSSPERLKNLVNTDRQGARDLFIDLLSIVQANQIQAMTLSEIYYRVYKS